MALSHSVRDDGDGDGGPSGPSGRSLVSAPSDGSMGISVSKMFSTGNDGAAPASPGGDSLHPLKRAPAKVAADPLMTTPSPKPLRRRQLQTPQSDRGPLLGINHTRSLSSTYLFYDYHEFTLLKRGRKEDGDGAPASDFRPMNWGGWNNLGANPAEEEFSSPDYYPWECVTIRVERHDEMDTIIAAIKNCFRAKIAPFSPNPQRALAKKKKSSALSNAVADWIDTARCEFCDIAFTLLNRRHHCRQCQRCVCGNCSEFMLVQGGEEARMCNRCTRVMHLDRSTARQRLATVAGKFHPACKALGVGKKGQLPRWGRFFRSGEVAVGSVSVEVIEALALPALDAGGKSDPYVRATITGYVNDTEWTPEHRYDISTSYCLATLSPVWRGSGARGGESLTLPVMCTSGAVLRLEVIDYDAIGMGHEKNRILGVVEIPLCDLSNSNNPYTSAEANGGYDGYEDKWYYLHPPVGRGRRVPFTLPFDPRHVSSRYAENGGDDAPQNFGLGSSKEILAKTLGLFRGPIDFFGDLTGIEFPRHGVFYNPSDEHRSPAKIHVRVKLYCSEIGDLLSHAWEPLTPKYTTPPFDPQTTFQYGLKIKRLWDPYDRLFKKIHPVLSWQRHPGTCLFWYSVLAAHIVFGHYFMYLLHVYLIIFFGYRLVVIPIEWEDSKGGSSMWLPGRDCDGMKDDDDSTAMSSVSFCSMGGDRASMSMRTPQQRAPRKSVEEEEGRINSAVSWIVKIFASGKQEMNKLQADMKKLGGDLYNINKHWDGSDIVATRVAFGVIIGSLALHSRFNHRVLWLIYTFLIYFRMSGERYFDRLERWCIGICRGIGKVMKRRAMLALRVMEIEDEAALEKTTSYSSYSHIPKISKQD